MITPDEKIKSREEIYINLRDALLARALWERREKEIEALEEQARGNEELDRHVRERLPEARALIDREIRKAHLRNLGRAVPGILRKVAVFLLVLNLGFTTAAAMVPSVRVKVMELLINIEREYTELSLRESQGASFEVPIDWKGSYFPSFIPEGYEIFEVVDAGICSITYLNSEDQEVSFLEGTEYSSVNINTEGAKTECITIHGRPGMIALREDGDIFIAWCETDRMLILGYTGTREDAIKIAESVIRIG